MLKLVESMQKKHYLKPKNALNFFIWLEKWYQLFAKFKLQIAKKKNQVAKLNNLLFSLKLFFLSEIGHKLSTKKLDSFPRNFRGEPIGLLSITTTWFELFSLRSWRKTSDRRQKHFRKNIDWFPLGFKNHQIDQN